jgi:predicted transcriptional regulator
MIRRGDFLQHVGRDCHAIYFVGLQTHLQLLSSKRFATSSVPFPLFSSSRELRVSIPVEVSVKTAKTGAVTVRLDPELKGRLAEAAVKLDLSENDIVRHALRAAVNAIEANDYKIELPLEMALAKGPIESRVTGSGEPEFKYPRGKRH